MITPLPRLLASLLLPLAIGAGSSAAVASAAAAKATTHTITMEGSRFIPSTLVVKAGDTVVWVNKDLFPHTATSKAGTFDSQAIAVGKSWTYTAVTRGDYAYTCTFHPTMKGKLRVQ
jgi:plastocyanin